MSSHPPDPAGGEAVGHGRRAPHGETVAGARHPPSLPVARSLLSTTSAAREPMPVRVLCGCFCAYFCCVMSIDLGSDLVLIRGFQFTFGGTGATRCISTN